MTAATPFILPKKVQEGIIQYNRACYSLLNTQWNIRLQMQQVDLAYMRENDFTTVNRRAQIANQYGDSTKLRNVTIPIVLPQVENFTAHMCSVFLSGNPIFDVVASPEYEDAAIQMSTILENNQIRGGWTREIELFFRDSAKYNISFLEASWAREITAVLETDLSFSASQGKPKEVVWEGNRIKRWDPYNSFWDTRVSPVDLPKKGEFAGTVELMGRVQLKQFIATLPDKLTENLTEAFESGIGFVSGANIGIGGAESYFVPQINPNAILNYNPQWGTDWMMWAQASGTVPKINYKNMYTVTTIYGRILPADFGMRVPSPNTPQVWKFIIINNQVLIYAERQTNAHGMIPILVGSPMEDGLAYQTKSFANNVRTQQEIASALWTSIIQSRRRAISDRKLFDPSKVREVDINSDNPSAAIPVRPAAYGKPLDQAVYAFPYRDDQAGIIFQESDRLEGMADKTSGFNRAQQGLFTKGNRTKQEFDTITAHADARPQMTALKMEVQVFAPLKEILKLDVLQYQGGGISLFSPSKSRGVKIDPVALRKAVFTFKVSDGLIPTEKEIDGDAFATALQAIASQPSLGAGYNITPMFSYLMKTQGAKLSTFEKSPEQIAFEQANGAYQQTLRLIGELALKQGIDPSKIQWPPAPTPEQYKYDPSKPIIPDTSTGTSLLAAALSPPTAAAQTSEVPSNAGEGNVT
jgi:hypothetical protein